MSRDLEPHPLSELLPAMAPADYEALKAGIAAHGQIEPIQLLDGRILDGRHRYRACRELGIEPKVKPFAGPESPIEHLYNKSLHRNLNDSQKACAAVRIKPHFATLAEQRMKAGKPRTSSIGSGPVGTARDAAANLFGVSGRYVQDAELLLNSAPELFEQVFAGRLPITRAKRVYLRETRAREHRKKLKAARDVAVQDGWSIITGDCLQELARQPEGCARLVFVDPPYNLGFKYDADPTGDNLAPGQYLEWCCDLITQCHRVLSDDGTLCILHCEEYQHQIGTLIEMLGGFTIRRLVVWYETFGENCTNNFNRTCRFLYYAVRDPRRFTFNPAAFQVPSARAAVYNDPRAAGDTKNLDALWQVSRLQGTSIERIAADADAPTQLPLELMRRIVQGFSDPGDLVVDPCCGTGTTGHAALLADRQFLGIERSPKYAAAARDRLIVAAADLAQQACPEPIEERQA